VANMRMRGSTRQLPHGSAKSAKSANSAKSSKGSKGSKSYIKNFFGAVQAGQITEIRTAEKGESTIIIVNSDGVTTSQIVPAGLALIVKQGDIVNTGEALTLIKKV